MGRVIAWLLAGVLVWGLVAGAASMATADTLPPSVVRTVPASGETGVDAATTRRIAVTFSQDMQDGAWSFVRVSPETFPEIVGGPRYLADKRTCEIDVRLQPGRKYVIWINSGKFLNFRTADGKPAQPYPLEFETK